MIRFEDAAITGIEEAIRGMRNPMNSWDKSDSFAYQDGFEGVDNRTYQLGPNDYELMMKLAKGGPVHAKFRRMMVVYVDITAPLYWWKEFDTYKVGTVANSCSTMHKIHAKEFVLDDFSHEHLLESTMGTMSAFIDILNTSRKAFLDTNDKVFWWQMIQLLPSSYNQKRTVMMNYEVLAGIYPMRKNHKLDEWRKFCSWIEELPYSEIAIGDLEGQP